jgi:hypothetical protein
MDCNTDKASMAKPALEGCYTDLCKIRRVLWVVLLVGIGHTAVLLNLKQAHTHTHKTGPVSRQDCYENNTTEARVASSSVVKPRGIDVVMARLFKFAPPGMPYADWVAPSVKVLTHADFLQHRFSACCSHPFPPLDKSLRQVLTWPGGFFIESGGHDGNFQSNTLALEKFFGWRGLLIEPAMSNIAKIHANRNRSIAIHAGLVTLGDDGSKLSDPGGNPMGKIAIGIGNVEGRALSSLLDDLNVTEVDFWSLDVEGFEVESD